MLDSRECVRRSISVQPTLGYAVHGGSDYSMSLPKVNLDLYSYMLGDGRLKPSSGILSSDDLTAARSV